MSTRTSIILAAVLAILPAIPAFSADVPLRIATVDSKAIFEGFRGTKEAQAKYDKQVAGWEQEVADLQKELANIKEKAEKQSLMLSDEKKRDLEARFKSKSAELQKKVQELYGPQGKVVAKNEEFTAPIVAQIRIAVQQMAKAEGFDLVLDRSAGAVVYWKEGSDLTARLLDKMNADFEAGVAPKSGAAAEPTGTEKAGSPASSGNAAPATGGTAKP